MTVSSRHILQQGPTVNALARTLIRAAHAPKPREGASAPFQAPGPELHEVLPARPADLVRDYVRWVGGEPSSYRGILPPHMFSQWAFALQARSVESLPYRMSKVLNGGCSLQVNGPIPAGEPLDFRVRIAEIDESDARVVIRQESVTGTASCPEALVASNHLILPRGGSAKREGATGPKPKKERPRVPAEAREILYRKLGPKSGLDFAKLTGDFNPIHWLPPAAKAAGFPNVILHGFATMAIACEGIIRNVFSGDASAITHFEVRFVRPLVLPAKVGVFLDGKNVYVGDAPGGPAYLVGSYNL